MSYRVMAKVSITALLLLALGLGGAMLALPAAYSWLDRAYPPDLSRLKRVSAEVVDAEGDVLRVFGTQAGMVRLATTREQVSPLYRRLLIAVEDKRFHDHDGIDLLALGRAVAQAAYYGRVVSGASTLTMQTARLLEPRPRTLSAKLIEMFRARQLELRFTKDEILGMYLTLAPFGGNLEGARAASLAYFGKDPAALTDAEAALLVALPQAPSRYRPDRHPEAARAARAKILDRAAATGVLPEDRANAAKRDPLPQFRRDLPFLAPHLTRRLTGQNGGVQRIATTIDGALQEALEGLTRHHVNRLDPQANLGILVVENRTRHVLAYLGSADFAADERQGQVDMVRAIRSPGSTLKPLIYALAFDRGLAHPETLVRDAPTRFGSYTPANFRDRYHGEVTLREALQLSLNVPAVHVLEKLGPVVLTETLAQQDIDLRFEAAAEAPGLAIALGGAGITLEDLVRLYAALADDGRPRALVYGPAHPPDPPPLGQSLFREGTRWQISQILLGAPRPGSVVQDELIAKPRGIAFKTGTSYGFRDAWAVGFNQRFTVGVWVGRPDGTPSPGRFGAGVAAPLMFRVFDLLPPAPIPADKPAPNGVRVATTAELPPALQRLDQPFPDQMRHIAEPPPDIVFPLDGSLLRLAQVAGGLPLEADGGRSPLRWLVNGRPLDSLPFETRARWHPDGPGFIQVTLVDAAGRSAQVRVRLIDEPNSPLLNQIADSMR